jgi:hypothetical protein
MFWKVLRVGILGGYCSPLSELTVSELMDAVSKVDTMPAEVGGYGALLMVESPTICPAVRPATAENSRFTFDPKNTMPPEDTWRLC